MDFELTDEQEQFRRTVHDWTEREAPKALARELERHEHEYPMQIWDGLAAAGFHGVGIPERYGGQGGDVIEQMLLARGLARTLGGLGWVWGLSSFVGSKAIDDLGDEAQRARFLPPLARGEMRYAIAFTEPDGGSDLFGALRTEAKRVDGGWVLNGNKTWSTSAQVSDYLLTLARSGPAEPRRTDGLSAFLVPREAAGVTISGLPKLGMRALGACDVGLADVFVDDDLLLGEAGAAWQMLLPALNNERIIVAALCVGVLDGVLEDAIAYTNDRRAFGRPIGGFQAIQHMVADIAVWRAEAEHMVNHAAWLQATGRPCARETMMAKITCSENAVKAADHGIQILGGMGYSAETDMQRYWRDARLWRIGPVTNEMVRNSLAVDLGLPRSF
jgi:acyl-CoA dehydrogenase